MGYIAHHGIIFTSSSKCTHKAHKRAKEIFAEYGLESCVTAKTKGETNDTMSFLIAPDGSKEGWDTSASGEEARRKFIDWFEENRLKDEDDDAELPDIDKWFYGDVILVRFGGDEPTLCEIEYFNQ